MARMNAQAVDGRGVYAGSDAENMRAQAPRTGGYIPEDMPGAQAPRRAPVLSRMASAEDRIQIVEQQMHAGLKEAFAQIDKLRAELVG